MTEFNLIASDGSLNCGSGCLYGTQKIVFPEAMDTCETIIPISDGQHTRQLDSNGPGFNSTADLLAHYARVKKRIYAVRPKVQQTVEPERKQPTEPVVANAEYWQFNDHPMSFAQLGHKQVLAIMIGNLGMTPDVFFSLAKTGDLPSKRAIIVHFHRARGFSLHKIGELINRDHSSVLHSLVTFHPDGSRRSKSEIQEIRAGRSVRGEGSGHVLSAALQTPAT